MYQGRDPWKVPISAAVSSVNGKSLEPPGVGQLANLILFFFQVFLHINFDLHFKIFSIPAILAPIVTMFWLPPWASETLNQVSPFGLCFFALLAYITGFSLTTLSQISALQLQAKVFPYVEKKWGYFYMQIVCSLQTADTNPLIYTESDLLTYARQ